MTGLWDVAPYSLVQINRRFRDPEETSVNFYWTTWRNTPEDSRPILQGDSRSAGEEIKSLVWKWNQKVH
jgi:hypothetical protein